MEAMLVADFVLLSLNSLLQHEAWSQIPRSPAGSVADGSSPYTWIYFKIPFLFAPQTIIPMQEAAKVII